MPKVGVKTDSLKGLPLMDPGMYEFRVAGWKPKLSKKKDSVNLNPQLKVINHPKHNDRLLYENMNTQAGWIQQDFIHALGLKMDVQGEQAFLPGDFDGPEEDPSKWTYRGPIVGRNGKAEVVVITNNKGREVNAIKRYLCAISGCQEQHSTNLAG